MHRSRLQSVVVDCQNLDVGVAFWTTALACDLQMRSEQYAVLAPAGAQVRVILQAVPERKVVKSPVHIDIESDDIPAEVQRLESLGATRQEPIEDWWVMKDPCGNEFCVVPATSTWFEDLAHSWE